jgi:hypothetical protein
VCDGTNNCGDNSDESACPLTWDVVGDLPTGVTFANGYFTGTPTVQGDFPVVVSLTDANGCEAAHAYDLNILNANGSTCPYIYGPGSLTAGTVGTAYSFANTGWQQEWGTPTHYYLAGGALPPGVVLDDDGTLEGVPTVAGTYSFSLLEADATGCAGRSFTTNLVIAPMSCGAIDGGTCSPPTLTPSGYLPDATAGQTYSQSFTLT